jgi:DNA-binding transcriptional ArsR family regulator
METPHSPQPPDPQRERALAHPLRVRILETLRQRPATPEELAEELDVGVDVVTYHSRVLTRAGCLPLNR